MEEFARLYVNYIEPGLKIFLMFLLVMAVLAFWAKVKEGKLLDMASTVFHGTIDYTYKFFLFTGLGIWFVLRSIGRVFNIIFATVRDFFISRI
ncbi:MAG: hypothetical protein CMF60_05860 [Magnetococcales bacterium]|nr:hypothetical protein [Magnetococcales bacterium]MEC8067777.1 hypothetical protein [Pseudomonadota bacterium]|tara:strand:- start:143 stop:421 length:279 start_codon:yes stop_codon:yes gene_type:complete